MKSVRIIALANWLERRHWSKKAEDEPTKPGGQVEMYPDVEFARRYQDRALVAPILSKQQMLDELRNIHDLISNDINRNRVVQEGLRSEIENLVSHQSDANRPEVREQFYKRLHKGQQLERFMINIFEPVLQMLVLYFETHDEESSNALRKQLKDIENSAAQIDHLAKREGLFVEYSSTFSSAALKALINKQTNGLGAYRVPQDNPELTSHKNPPPREYTKQWNHDEDWKHEDDEITPTQEYDPELARTLWKAELPDK